MANGDTLEYAVDGDDQAMILINGQQLPVKGDPLEEYERILRDQRRVNAKNQTEKTR